jgi:glycosyltransferase involved in cell wall biosynthesis
MFSVLVPVYNHDRYIGAALDSLLAQEDADWEAIVVNDGSADRTPVIIEDYAKRDPRIRVFHKSNGGVSTALNYGLSRAKGEWICWLSSDDLFAASKLAIHRKAIAAHPECRFFFTHFQELADDTGRITDPPLWNDIPEKPWQVISALKGAYIHGNSICVKADAWAKEGGFDETLRQGQDYDMWLRLLLSNPAEFIPERTCITRVHPGQTTNQFPEACFFDSCKAVISILNTHRFEDLFPLLDLQKKQDAIGAVEKCLNVAADIRSPFLYGLGAHPALLLRLIEWVNNRADQRLAPSLKKLVNQRADAIAKGIKDRGHRVFWNVAGSPLCWTPSSFNYRCVEPVELAMATCWRYETGGNERAVPLRRYITGVTRGSFEVGQAGGTATEGNVVMVAQMGERLDASPPYGTLSATLAVAYAIANTGRDLAVVIGSDEPMGVIRGVPFIGLHEERDVGQALATLGPIDTLIGISRADIFRKVSARRRLVYHHGPHPIQETGGGYVSASAINKAGVHVVCPSLYTENMLVAGGIAPALVHVVRNGYDQRVFKLDAVGVRPPHSLIFAGMIVPYKGVDIALQSFKIVKRQFPDATFSLYGKTGDWSDCPEHAMEAEWLEGDMRPNWGAIERALPGTSYKGEAAADVLAQAFQAHSLLVMPSRVAETFGLVSLEAQACGCIPVLPKKGGFVETAMEGVTGYFYMKDDAEGLARAIGGLWNQHLPLESQRIEAAKWVSSSFAWETVGVEFVKVMNGVTLSHEKLYPMFYRAWLAKEIKSKVIDTCLKLYWSVMRWTKPFRHAVGLHRHSVK